MNTAEIESAILMLPESEFHKLADWFSELKQQKWDEQLEKDIADGKLDRFAQEAIEDFRAGRCRKI